ncbi:phosphoglycerate kinase [Mesorhizobium sp. BH1-1-4]|uniref:phosphoglycerate kinase n=1 Tax=Mesorhizobium sp. BH1-1-4 TaxID=2876662 RepID=UPI001CD0BD26|nr:phosphoglycerate kinase [Mesorhizobium sp. BH1-1-4]MBZ9993953.1 phosphoglycerate kinase [Mesorhizobium sp. BH1-1-4]
MKPLPDIRTAEIAGKTVLVRADLNVPLKNGMVADATRIVRFAPTVRDLLARGAKVVVMTHLGRPDGDANPIYSVRPVTGTLSTEVGREVVFVPDCVGPTAEKAAKHHQDGKVLLLENLRFHKGEEANSRNFALRLSVNGDLFVNDAFSCAHRAHASTHAIAEIMPAYAGPSLLAEVAALTAALDAPEKPVAALVGGSKVSSKIRVLKNLIGRMDHLIIGGGMANTFLAASGYRVGRSVHEPDCVSIARDIMEAAAANGCRILLPSDVTVARMFEAEALATTVPVAAIPDEAMALDVGPRTVAEIKHVLNACRTLLWNGPLGAFEMRPFGEATFAVARHAAALSKAGQLATIAGGGDTAAALSLAGVADQITYLSTAGGAFLEWLEGCRLPGIEVLRKRVEHSETV